jgi:hypothetical protein
MRLFSPVAEPRSSGARPGDRPTPNGPGRKAEAGSSKPETEAAAAADGGRTSRRPAGRARSGRSVVLCCRGCAVCASCWTEYLGFALLLGRVEVGAGHNGPSAPDPTSYEFVEVYYTEFSVTEGSRGRKWLCILVSLIFIGVPPLPYFLILDRRGVAHKMC